MAGLPPPVIEIVEAIAVSGVCSVIYAYGDDGSDEKRERVTAVSVIAGYEEWWREVEAQWIADFYGGQIAELQKLLVQHLPGDGATVTAAETLPGAVGRSWI